MKAAELDENVQPTQTQTDGGTWPSLLVLLGSYGLLELIKIFVFVSQMVKELTCLDYTWSLHQKVHVMLLGRVLGLSLQF